MAEPNPYDQFDASPAPAPNGANPYDQFDHPIGLNDLAKMKPTTPVRKAIPLTSMPSETYKGLASSAANFGTGVYHAAQHPIDSVKALWHLLSNKLPSGANDLAQGLVLNLADPTVLDQSGVMEQDPRAKEKMGAAAHFVQSQKDRWISHPGEEFGTAARETIAHDPVGALADASTLLGGAGGLARGVAASAPSVTAQVAARAAAPILERGAAAINPFNIATSGAKFAGSFVPGLNPGIARVGNAMSDAAIPSIAQRRWKPSATAAAQNELLRDATEGHAHQVATSMVNRGAREIVPGSPMTAAEAVADQMNATNMATMGKDAAKNLTSDTANITDAQNAARLASIRDTVSGAPGELERRETARAADAVRDYAASDRTMVNAGNALYDLQGRPSIATAFERARLRTMDADRPFGVVNPATGVLQYSGRDLHLVKEELDTIAHEAGGHTRESRQARQDFINWVEHPTNNPAYRTARENFQAHSQAIDRMSLGRVLEQKLTGALQGEDAGKLRWEAYADALDNPGNWGTGNSIIRKGTGERRYNRLEDIFTPDQMTALENIRQDLARSKSAETQANLPNVFSGRLNTAATDMAGGLVPPPVRAVTNAMTGNIDKTIADNVGRATRSPQAMNTMLNQLIDRDKELHLLKRGANAMYQGAIKYPSVYNAMDEQRKKDKGDKK